MAASSKKKRIKRIQDMALRNMHREERSKIEKILTQVVHVSLQCRNPFFVRPPGIQCSLKLIQYAV